MYHDAAAVAAAAAAVVVQNLVALRAARAAGQQRGAAGGSGRAAASDDPNLTFTYAFSCVFVKFSCVPKMCVSVQQVRPEGKDGGGTLQTCKGHVRRALTVLYVYPVCIFLI